MAYGARQVPQNIMSVQFKIFDLMTLKQFGITMGLFFACFIVFLIFSAPWNIIITLVIVIVGGTFTFIPFNGEPFVEFLNSYLEAMISPQRRIWHRKGFVLKSAAEKAKFYRYGNEEGIEEEKVNTFKFFDKFGKKHAETEKLDTDEQKFLTTKDTNENGYTPPGMNQRPNAMNQNTNNDQNISVISQKSVQNTVRLNNPQQQPSQQSIPQQTQVVSQNTAGQPNQPQAQFQAAPLQQHNQQQSQPSFISKENPQSQNQIDQQNRMRGEEEESAVRNFVFGSIENYKDEPVAGAAVILKNMRGETLEVVYSNAVGEFKTNYEYTSGQYTLYVNADAKDFNEIVINHTPIDPMPLQVHPRDYQEKKVQREQEESDTVSDTSSNDEIFDGSYDSKVFDIGQDYLEKNVAPQTQSTQINNAGMANTSTLQQEQPVMPTHLSTEQSAAAVNTTGTSHTAYAQNAGNMFDQMMNNRVVNDYGDKSLDNITLQHETTPATNQINSSAQQAAQDQRQRVVNDVQILEYSTMQNAAVPFDDDLIRLPNTVNGILVDPAGYGLSNTLIRIYDKTGNIITSMNTDTTGRFYTYSPLPNNSYTMYVSKNGQNLAGFNIDMNGNVIPPKIISFVY
jgi:hypothetical protein